MTTGEQAVTLGAEEGYDIPCVTPHPPPAMPRLKTKPTIETTLTSGDVGVTKNVGGGTYCNMVYELKTQPGPTAEDGSHEYEVIGKCKTTGQQAVTLGAEEGYDIPCHTTPSPCHASTQNQTHH